MTRRWQASFAVLGMAALTALAPRVAQAGAYQVYVGYADSVRPSPFFPSTWQGSAQTGLFAGAGPTFDAGAVGIYNSGSTTLTLDDMKVVLGAGQTFQLWASYLVGGFSLAAGQWAIFTQTAEYNFDTSDYPVLFNNDPTNNCSTGLLASSATCVNNQPQVTADVNGHSKTFADTAQVLDTGGYDSVNSNPCVGGNNGSGNSPGSCNESLNWRLIGTTGVNDPNGGGPAVPEPATLTLFGAGLAGLGFVRRRRRSA